MTDRKIDAAAKAGFDAGWQAAIDECMAIARDGAKECCEGDSEWHRGFRYAASNTALGIADTISSLRSPAESPKE